MAKATSATVKRFEKSRVSRPGIHAKTKTSKLKKSKNYRKAYKAQGR